MQNTITDSGSLVVISALDIRPLDKVFLSGKTYVVVEKILRADGALFSLKDCETGDYSVAQYPISKLLLTEVH